MIIALNINPTNNAHAMAMAQILSICATNNVPFEFVGTDAHVDVPSEPTHVASKASARTLEDAVDVTVQYVRDGKNVVARTLDGKFIGQSSVKKIANRRIRENGGVWDSDARAYVFENARKASAVVKKLDTLVLASDIEAERVKAQKRAERKANKAE